MNARTNMRVNVVRPIALAWVCVSSGALVAFVLKVAFELQISKLAASAITFAIAVLAAFIIFPRRLKQPFEAVGLPAYLRGLGFYLPKGVWKHILLGALLAALTLSGMLIGSLLTGRYAFDPGTLNATQILFSVNPGIWEEFFFRGVIMFLFLRLTASVERAALLQILLFGLAHIKSLDPWAWVDVISVMVIAAAFTYTAWKTRALVAGIAFHFLHNALLFLPQVPGGDYYGWEENLAFFGCLWLAVGLGLVLTKIASERHTIRAEDELYTLEKVAAN